MSGHPTLKRGSRGSAVTSMKAYLVRGLRAKGLRRWATLAWLPVRRAKFDAITVKAVRAFQKAHRLQVDGVVGPATWGALLRYPHPASKRAVMKAWMNWALRHEPSYHYRQSRPIPLARLKRRALPIYTDCSGSVTGCCYAAGVPDPNGRKYDGSGYTGTLRAHLRRRSGVSACKVGDPIIYGTGNGSHVVMVYEPGPDPLVWSHGQESGPGLYRHSVELRAHGGYCTAHDLGIE